MRKTAYKIDASSPIQTEVGACDLCCFSLTFVSNLYVIFGFSVFGFVGYSVLAFVQEGGRL